MRFTTVGKKVAPFITLSLCACDGSQSTFSGLGLESARILTLSWVMFTGAALILGLVILATGIALFGSRQWRQHLDSNRFVIWLGIAFPVVTLTALLIYGFYILRVGLPTPTNANTINISVTGYQWWWRVIYRHPDGTTTETANELRIPVGTEVELSLRSADVLHSFWVPAYAGKVDMVPGRTNHLNFTALKPGLVRGQCAEYCGGAHALMAFHVEALTPEGFAAWLSTERDTAAQTALSKENARGKDLFLGSGCGGCHAVRGTPATGRIGPDLTHVGNRHSIGAGTLTTNQANMEKWIHTHQTIKPGNKMPAFDFLSSDERRAIARFLISLE